MGINVRVLDSGNIAIKSINSEHRIIVIQSDIPALIALLQKVAGIEIADTSCYVPTEAGVRFSAEWWAEQNKEREKTTLEYVADSLARIATQLETGIQVEGVVYNHG